MSRDHDKRKKRSRRAAYLKRLKEKDRGKKPAHRPQPASQTQPA